MWDKWTFVRGESKPQNNPVIYIGCMTGTSVDHFADFSAVIFDKEGMPVFVRNAPIEIPPNLRSKLLNLSKTDAADFSRRDASSVEVEFTEFLASAYLKIINDFGLNDYPKDNIVLSPHGQSIDHQPFCDNPYSDILLNGEYLSQKTGYPVVSRHRQAALVVSSAAPLAPVLIQKLFYSDKINTVLLNGGGVANICVLPKNSNEPVLGYDTGPANGPIDEVVQYIINNLSDQIPGDLKSEMVSKGYDVGGQCASRGKVNSDLLGDLLSHEFFSRPMKMKSADRAAFSFDRWVRTKPDSCGALDILATVSSAVAISIANAIIASLNDEQRKSGVRLLQYGGLSHNRFVSEQLKSTLNSSGKFEYVDMPAGIDADYFEAMLFAYLGYCAHRRVPVDLSYCAREVNPLRKALVIPGSVSYPA